MAVLAVFTGLLCATAAFGASAPPAATGKGSSASARILDARVNHKAAYASATAARPGAEQAALAEALRQSAAIAGALRSLQRTQPGLAVDFSGTTGAPSSVSNRRGTLTEAAPGRASEPIVRDFMRRNASLFGLSSSDLDDLVALGDSAGGKSGMRMLRMEQRIDGRPVFQSETRFLLDRQGRLVKSTGQLVPDARARVDAFEPAALISAPQAVANLLASAGRTASPASFTVGSNVDGKLTLAESDSHVAGEITAREILFPLAPGLLVPAWSLVVFTEGEQDWYAVVDAETGDLLWRKNIRANVSAHDARFRVYVQADGVTPADNPAPHSPTTVTPGANTQFPEIAPTIVSMHTAQDPVASPNGWIDDCPGGICTANETQTLGNNVLACLDRAAPANVCDTDAGSVLDGNGRPVGNPDTNGRDRDFLGTAPRDFQTSYLPPPQGGDPEAGQTATGAGASGTNAQDQFRRGAVTQLFYITNWYHDRLHSLGFDEASANFQQTNFSGMGLGGDRVQADAQDNAGTNNANFATPPDGVAGRMQMFRFTGPTIDRDGGLDAEIVIHELTHGTSNRLVGNGAGLNWDIAAGMGEGWSDFYALSLLNNTNADDPDASYAAGSYATYKLGGLLDNYLYAIRRFPYSTDNAVNPLTWADADDVTNNLGGGIAPDPLGFNDNGGMEVHNSGEIWALTLWEVRSRIIADPAGANGDVPTGNETMLQIVTDGLKLTPIDPNFIDARDALFEADCANNGCANEESIWAGFADRGLGYGANSPYNTMFGYTGGHLGIKESFEVPKLDVVDATTDVTIDDASSNNNGALDPGEAVRISARLSNPWRAAAKGVASATATLSTATPGVTIYDADSTYGAIAAQGDAVGDSFLFTIAPTVPCGSAIDFTLTVTSALGTTQTTFRLRVGTATGTGPVVTYTKDPSPDVGIPDNFPHGVSDTISITDDFEIADLDLRFDSVTHTFTGDLTGMLRSPGGIGVDFMSLIGGLIDGGPGDNIVNMVIDDDVAAIAANDMVQATSAAAPYTKSWLPTFNSPWTTLAGFPAPDAVGNLSRYDGTSTAGTWTLHMSDQFLADSGTLNAWSLLVTPVQFSCTAFAPSLGLTATKSVSGTFRTGNTVTYTITLTNSGTAGQADNAGDEFTDVLPAALDLVSATASSGTSVADTGTNTVTWNGMLAPLGGSVTITITATIDAGVQGATISNQGTMSFDADSNGSNESSLVTDDPGTGASGDPTAFIVESADLSATQTVSGAFTRGSTAIYTVTLNNAGTGASLDNAGDEFTETLPAGLTLVSASTTSGTAVANVGTGTVTWNGSIPAGGSVTITINATVDASASGTVSSQGTVSFDADLDGTNETTGLTDDPGTGAQGDATAFVVQFAQVTGTKAVAGSFVPGTQITYTIVLANSGSIAAGDNAGNELTDVLPATLTLVSANATSGTAVADTGTNTVTWNGTVAAAGDVTLTITAAIAPDSIGVVVANQANIAFDGNADGSNESSAVTDDASTAAVDDATVFIVSGPHLIAEKSVTGTFLPGGLVTYTIVLGNNGNQPMGNGDGHEMTDVLPASLDLESATATAGAISAVGDTVHWDGALVVGASVTVTIVATIEDDATGTIGNQASLSYDADDNSVNESTGLSDDPALPGTADVTSFSLSGADLQISKSNGVDGVVSELDTVYTIEVANGGPEAVVGARVRDLLPLQLRDAEWTCTAVGTTCPATGSTGNIDVLVDLPVNAMITFELVAEVSPDDGSSVSNTATVETPPNIPELDASDNSATDTDVIRPIGIFADGFETVPQAKLRWPPSAKTLEALGGR